MSKEFSVRVSVVGGSIDECHEFAAVPYAGLLDMEEALHSIFDAAVNAKGHAAKKAAGKKIPGLSVLVEAKETSKDGRKHRAPKLFASRENNWYDLSEADAQDFAALAAKTVAPFSQYRVP
jgi:hypothetical protein